MNRRDTIIVAVLLNAGLLVILFMTTLKPSQQEEAPLPVTVLASHHNELVSPPLAMAPMASPPDPLDEVLQKYVTPQPSVAATTHPQFLADPQPVVSSQEPVQQPVARAEEPTPHYKDVKVKKGDVLERIARQHKVSVAELMRANQMTSTRLRIGQVLKVPTHGTGAAPARPQSGEGQYYTVKAGDSPWTIAVKHHMKVEELLQLNGLDDQKARHLKAGDQLRIR